MEVKMLLSPYRKYTCHPIINGKKVRISFEMCRYSPSNKEELDALMSFHRFGIDYCLEEDYPTLFRGANDKNPKLLQQTLTKISQSMKAAEAKNKIMADENAALKAELEALKKGESKPKEPKTPKAEPKKD